MKRPFLISLLCIVLATLLPACHDDDNGPDSITGEVADIATFKGNNATGAIFEMQRINDSPLITLQAQAPVSVQGLVAGDRVFLSYIPADGRAYASGIIAVQQVDRINQDVLREADLQEISGWDRDGVYIYSLWRTGRWVNIECRLPYDPAPRRFSLVLDKATSGQPVPDLYLVHRMGTQVESFGRDYYASFDISALWERPTVEGVRIHVANTNLTDLKTITLTK